MQLFCRQCERHLPPTCFHKRSDTKSGLRSNCKDCVRERNNSRYHNSDKKAAAKRSRKHSLRILYGISPEQYEQMFKNQQGLCAICQQPEKNKSYLSIDHCHSSQEIRSLLCGNCNSAIGLLQDSSKIIFSAASYLQSFGK